MMFWKYKSYVTTTKRFCWSQIILLQKTVTYPLLIFSFLESVVQLSASQNGDILDFDSDLANCILTAQQETIYFVFTIIVTSFQTNNNCEHITETHVSYQNKARNISP